ncbi:MAG: hypothetical protein UT63_C0010G0012 [Candidatus Gottesmanbacteria bacterium GW2011_GWC2_39_8]|uniref:Uncharacterized protein n=1 Tax=Candidatus Gottesmanbacteria bacterium GW2011_GWC2_39_8 TaxID=1618450 RepID=A0A0G0Q164_9BACT|nr:MAG: hypothetical protein UT63_C0010G0012 [Candidatus Gottesmanbacteria bacterium GW2011_GWC2_39_8]
MGLDRVLEDDRFLTFRIGANGEKFFPAVRAEIHLVDFRARGLDGFDSEAVGEEHPGLVPVDLEFGAKIVGAEGTVGSPFLLHPGLKLRTLHQFLDRQAKASRNPGDHFWGGSCDVPHFKVRKVGLLDAKRDQALLWEFY